MGLHEMWQHFLCSVFGYCPRAYDPRDDELVARWDRLDRQVEREGRLRPRDLMRL